VTGIAEKDAVKEATRLAPRINRLLDLSGLDVRVKK
jgi:hypothetical protein